MINFNLENFLIYFCLAWGTNISLNFLYVIKRYIPEFHKIDYPIDFGLKYKTERIIGESTTLIGLLLCLSMSLAIYRTGFIVWSIIPIIVYSGHAAGSFIKRRLHKRGGEFLPVIDHGDYMLLLGALFVLLGYISIWFALSALALSYILHPLACLLAYKLNLREYPY